MEQPIEVSPQLRKRNVYWDSPIKSQVNISAKIENDSNEDSENAQPPTENERATDQTAGDDDGFESLNGKSSSGEEMTAGVLEMEIINDDLLDSATKHLITAGGTGDCDPEAINGNVKVSSLHFLEFPFSKCNFLSVSSIVMPAGLEIFLISGKHCQ